MKWLRLAIIFIILEPSSSFADVELWTAAYKGDIEEVRSRLNRLGETEKELALEFFVEVDPKCVKSLSEVDGLDKPYLLNALQIASYNGFEKIVELLLDHRADANFYAGEKTCTTALNLACAQGHLLVVEILLARGARVNLAPNGLTALMYASHNGHLLVVQRLLEQHGIRVNANFYAHTAYTCATKNRWVNVMLALRLALDLSEGVKS